MNLSIFTVFLKNKNIIFKIRRSKVTDYAALTFSFVLYLVDNVYIDTSIFMPKNRLNCGEGR